MSQTEPSQPNVTCADGASWPALGLGTWRYGESAAHRGAEEAALRRAFEIGYRVIDTAEMYADGGAESVLGQALAGAQRAGALRREDLFVVTKVYPHNAGRTALRKSCEASLRRLGLDCIDLYLLHWRGGVPLAETVAGFEELRQRGAIARWGVSNFDVEDLRELAALDAGSRCAANQVYYSLGERGPEFDLLPWQRERRMPLMAYCPIDQGALATHPVLRQVAARHGASAAQVALAALLAQDGVMSIPKSADPTRLQENWDAQRLRLSAEDLAALGRAFPPPRRKQPLVMR